MPCAVLIASQSAIHRKPVKSKQQNTRFNSSLEVRISKCAAISCSLLRTRQTAHPSRSLVCRSFPCSFAVWAVNSFVRLVLFEPHRKGVLMQWEFSAQQREMHIRSFLSIVKRTLSALRFDGKWVDLNGISTTLFECAGFFWASITAVFWVGNRSRGFLLYRSTVIWRQDGWAAPFLWRRSDIPYNDFGRYSFAFRSYYTNLYLWPFKLTSPFTLPSSIRWSTNL